MTCCPSRGGGAAAPGVPAPDGTVRADALVRLRGGRFEMGTRDTFFPEDGEGPPRRVRVKPFAISATAVTNAEFAAFVAATGYVTEAERYSWTYVFFGLLDAPDAHAPLPGLEWWRKVDGAAWHAPQGPGSTWEDIADHPVVHVSHRDASAYAAWAGGRLPTEAEWEFAALGGRDRARFPWGDAEPDDDSFHPCNIWQGRFPHEDTGADGYVGTAPVRSFAPNGYGLYNMCGNTWEWTADRHRVRSLKRAARAAAADARATPSYTVKGGSFLCHKSYCYRYRIAARSFNTPDSTTSHTGFRIVVDVGA
ncbi:MAG: formylglycine-generating enzyme family protein, partial [Pseudomonadota bacterium]